MSSSLGICNRIAKAIERQVTADFPGLRTHDPISDEASVRRMAIWLSVFDPTRRTQHLADYFIAVELVEAERYSVDLYAQASVDGDANAEDIATRFARPDLSVVETVRYYTPGVVRGVAVQRGVEVSMGRISETLGLEELEGEAFLARTAKMASEWLRVLREVLQSAEPSQGAAFTAG